MGATRKSRIRSIKQIVANNGENKFGDDEGESIGIGGR